jgi:tetratricopeptide (TPR) repeat protein
MGAAVAAAVICALVRVPTSISGASAFERGQRDEALHKYHEAAAEYRRALNAFPDATLPLARLAIVEYKDGDYDNAAQTLHQLAGRKSDKELCAEVNSVIHEMERSAP